MNEERTSKNGQERIYDPRAYRSEVAKALLARIPSMPDELHGPAVRLACALESAVQEPNEHTKRALLNELAAFQGAAEHGQEEN